MPLDLGEKLVNAARTADLALLKRLLKSKSVDVDYVDASGYSALRLACLNGQASAVKVLLKAGATVDLRSCHSITALHVACTLNQVECAELLIGAGATVDIPDLYTETTPLYARRTTTTDRSCGYSSTQGLHDLGCRRRTRSRSHGGEATPVRCDA